MPLLAYTVDLRGTDDALSRLTGLPTSSCRVKSPYPVRNVKVGTVLVSAAPEGADMPRYYAPGAILGVLAELVERCPAPEPVTDADAIHRRVEFARSALVEVEFPSPNVFEPRERAVVIVAFLELLVAMALPDLKIQELARGFDGPVPETLDLIRQRGVCREFTEIAPRLDEAAAEVERKRVAAAHARAAQEAAAKAVHNVNLAESGLLLVKARRGAHSKFFGELGGAEIAPGTKMLSWSFPLVALSDYELPDFGVDVQAIGSVQVTASQWSKANDCRVPGNLEVALHYAQRAAHGEPTTGRAVEDLRTKAGRQRHAYLVEHAKGCYYRDTPRGRRYAVDMGVRGLLLHPELVRMVLGADSAADIAESVRGRGVYMTDNLPPIPPFFAVGELVHAATGAEYVDSEDGESPEEDPYVAKLSAHFADKERPEYLTRAEVLSILEIDRDPGPVVHAKVTKSLAALGWKKALRWKGGPQRCFVRVSP